ncbi:MAG TPA: glycosyl hydrolase [Methylomirabilota bacterium]|nr:glycosyl hydrolase [Methylomirabilota bacterium]
MKLHTLALIALILVPAAVPVVADDDAYWLTAETLAGLELRALGPAVASGRIGDLAVDPTDESRIFAAVASGGVWRSENGGTTWEPVFDSEGSYSIGCVTIDPNDPNVVWVGTGENNSQRSVSFGDGVYKSLDGGTTWTNMGLAESEHIGNIVVDPRDSDVVWVAAQGPLWRSGGDRGLYRTSDGGATWERVLHVSDDTGIAEVRLHPDDPDTILATAYQRRRHTWTLINGGPESGLYKSTDGGETWREITAGLPEVDMGRMGLCISPVDTDVVYGVVDAARDEGGFFRSSDRGESWHKRSDHAPGGDYYNELFCDPEDVDRVYSMDVWMQVTVDGGETFANVGEQFKHVDNHALWIDPSDPRHLIAGSDGGIYETRDRGATWAFVENLPVTQFYRVAVDSSEPFWFIYGGTQDNATLGGPTRTRRAAGIANEDWFVTVFGDGFETVVDPVEPNLVYSQWQYGGLVRHDRATGEIVDIQPQPAPGEEPYRFNWDAPVIISPHSPTRLYFAAQKLFRSEDRGNTWTVVSGDLSRGIDRDELPVMGRIWGPDAVHKSASTSIYGNAVSLTESPLEEGLIWVGTDDGLVHVTSDGGASWRTIGDFPGVPKYSYVAELEASRHDADTVYATFSDHKQGDFTPYVLKSTDRGASWTSIRGDLPDRELAWTVAEDHVEPDLLFLGAEFGLFVTVDGGRHWVGMTGDLPTIAVRDLEIQRRENDLALATFGRGFYVLDDYTPLRHLSEDALAADAALFPVKDALRYVETSRLGLPTLAKAFQGDTYYTAPNPPFGAVFTYHLKDGLKTRRERRLEAEKEAEERGETPPYPSPDELRAEDEENEPRLVLTVRDADGAVVQRVGGPREAGLHRVAWNLRFPSPRPTDPDPGPPQPWESPRVGPLALPGAYSVTLEAEVDGELRRLAGPESFRVVDLGGGTLPVDDPAAALAFQRQAADLQRAVLGAVEAASEMNERLDHLRQAILDTPGAGEASLVELAAVEAELDDVLVELRGDRSRARRNEPVPPSIRERIDRIVDSGFFTTQPPTTSHRDGYRFASDAFVEQLAALRALETRLTALEATLEAAGAPWTPGRLPTWPRQE